MCLRHAFAGPNAQYDDPYRLYNLDVAYHIEDIPLGLYGSIPVMFAQKPGLAVAVFL